MSAYEVNFDGLIGPTHNYSGLSHGNLASANNARRVSQPRAAALQGLNKMWQLTELGLQQGVLLPQQRPHLPTLRALGFSGTDQAVIEQVARSAPELLASCYSASCMWTANAATVSPSADTADGKVHFTAANLNSMFHRSIEHPSTSRLLQAIFSDGDLFAHHSALPAGAHFGDEGAANHNRLAASYDAPGVELFVYGRYAFRDNKPQASRFPSRQTYEASQAISRLHQLDENAVVYAQQSPAIIDAGAFHNDVVSVANLNTLFLHEAAFVDKQAMQAQLQRAAGDTELHFVEVPTAEVSLQDAISSYLFNSQLVSLPNSDGMTLILPQESRENPAVYQYLTALQQADTPIKAVKFVDVRQSMQNGGGPACLRLRVALTDQELAAVNPRFLMNDELYARLVGWVERHYRERLSPEDLADPQLMQESFTALDELTQIFQLGSFYEFQQN
ncbi:MAG: N-succinylarginine dihydrolase [Gammaproteobacteria bacterium]|nr:N-succinylarginine dihydrolase [Gammaproteobacteria bacterium]